MRLEIMLFPETSPPKKPIQRGVIKQNQVSGTVPSEDITIFTARVHIQNSVVVVVVGKFLW
jgi:hypothetical protein